MRTLLRTTAGASVLGLVLLGTTLVGTAAAATLACGQVITTSTTLDSDVGPCPNNGIIVGADNITLDLGGHRVFGTPNPGDGAGVLLVNRRGVTVTSGTVSDFDGGVVITGGTANTVTRIVARDNVGRSQSQTGPDTPYGDGIAIEGSTNNSIVGNVATHNGPFSGIGLFTVPDPDHPFPAGATSGNLIQGNSVTDNTACRGDAPDTFCDNDGIRLEPSVGPNNRIIGNSVRGSPLDGISLFADADNNVVQGNVANANGFLGAVPGDGIRVFSSRNLIERNVAQGNAGGGISVGRRTFASPGSLPNNRTTGNPRGKNNTITNNRTSGNAIWDLWDSNPNCDNNVWRANTFQKAQPPCTTTP